MNTIAQLLFRFCYFSTRKLWLLNIACVCGCVCLYASTAEGFFLSKLISGISISVQVNDVMLWNCSDVSANLSHLRL